MKRILLPLLAAAALVLAGCAVPEGPTAVQPPEAGEPTGKSKAAKKAVPIKLTAKRTPYRAEQFATGGPYSCVRAVVTNQTQGNLQVNPYFFAITGTDGEKREAATGAAKREFHDITLAPGEKASGTVCAETKVPAKVLTFTDGLSEAARAAVG